MAQGGAEGRRVARASRHRRIRHGRILGRSGSRSPLVAVGVPLLLAALAAGVGLFAAAASYYHDVTASIPTPQQAIAQQAGGAKIYDRHGTLLYQFLDPQHGYQKRVPLDQISPLVQEATIATEDASFYSNPGISISGIARAAIENLTPGRTFLDGPGGSTITQQLVKQLYFTPQERQERSLSRKLREAVIALKLTQDYNKQQILDWYLNEIPYGSEFTGIEAASEGYFGLPAKDLTLGQAAFLAGLPQSPSQYDPFLHFAAAKARQSEVLDLMVEHGYISQTTANWARLEQIKLTPKPQPFLAPHFVLYVADYLRKTLGEQALMHGGLSVVTTLDLNLQDQAQTVLDHQIAQHEAATGAHNGAVVIISPPTGQILAMVGSRNYFDATIDGTVNNALALRSPGSTLKPFTYVTAFEHGWGPEWPIVDSPITYTAPGTQPFTPVNPDHRSHGVIPAREALGNSLNVPAFKTILWAGVQNMINTAKSMGITTLDGHQLGPAVTLGGSDVKLLDMVYGYATFANAGTMAGVPTVLALPPGNRKLDPNPVLFVTDRAGRIVMNNTQPHTEQVIKPAYAYLITQIISNDANRQIIFGAGSDLHIAGYRVAAKSGASQPFPNSDATGDTWALGYTPDVAVGVWVGNSDYAPMYNLFSTTIAGAAWHDIMLDALKSLPQRHPFVRPPGLVEATVCVPSGIVAPAGAHCPTVTGLFAQDALSKQDARWWGGRELPSALPLSARIDGIPAGITGWQRYLAEEYLRTYGAPPTPTPTPQTTAVPAGTPSPSATPTIGATPAASATREPTAKGHGRTRR